MEDWRLQALQSMQEIQHIGNVDGCNKIDKLACSHDGIAMPQSGNY